MQEKLQLHDIKPLVDIQEYSFYYFLAITFIGTILLFSIVYLFYRWYKNKNKYNERKAYKKILDTLDLSDTKNSAYALSFYGATYKDDSQRHQDMYDNLTKRLEQYKYKKTIEKFDDEILGYIELYKGMIDV